MIEFTKPENLDGAKLRDELKAQNVAIGDDKDAVTVDDNGILWLNIAKKDEVKARSVVIAHQG